MFCMQARTLVVFLQLGDAMASDVVGDRQEGLIGLLHARMMVVGGTTWMGRVCNWGDSSKEKRCNRRN